MNDNFCVFILSHGRPDNVITYKTLLKCGYTGKIFFIIDNEDILAYKYIKNFGNDRVIIFNKKEMADKIDEANNFDNRKVIVHARNFCFIAAKKLGIKYFVQLDDDYSAFEYRFEKEDKLKVMSVCNMDYVFAKYLQFFCETKFYSVAFAQGGDYIGGAKNSQVVNRFLKRKAMNSFFCSTDKEFQFIGSINEDVNTYAVLGSIGVLFGTIPMVSLVQKATQQQKGGMTDIYKLSGTYIKSFTTVLMHPSGVKVAMMKSNNPRLHHLINWKHTVPVIISEKYRKV